MSVSAAKFGALGLKFLNDTFSEFAQEIVIEVPDQTSDFQGGFEVVWNTFATVDAFILKQSGKEEFKQGRVLSNGMFNIHISHLPGLTDQMRIIFDSEEYQIRSINDIAVSNQWMIIEAEKGVAQ